MVRAEDAINIYKYLTTDIIQVWLNGGWGIDALHGKQTRPHKDLDIFVLLDDVSRMCEVLGGEDYSLKVLLPENRWLMDRRGIKTETAFVLQDPRGHELDVHAIYFDKENNGLPAWEENEGFVLTPQDLNGRGMIAEFMVRCITAEKQMLCHTGYMLPEQQLRDLQLLHEKFGVEYLNEDIR